MEGENQTPLNKEGAARQNADKNTGMAIVAYLLFFVPLLTDAKNDPFVKYHVKQGLILFLGWIAVSVISFVFVWVPFIGSFIWLLYGFMLVLLVMGIVNAANGKQKPLPLVGQFAEKFNF